MLFYEGTHVRVLKSCACFPKNAFLNRLWAASLCSEPKSTKRCEGSLQQDCVQTYYNRHKRPSRHVYLSCPWSLREDRRVLYHPQKTYLQNDDNHTQTTVRENIYYILDAFLSLVGVFFPQKIMSPLKYCCPGWWCNGSHKHSIHAFIYGVPVSWLQLIPYAHYLISIMIKL